jgi:hemerythrin-like domain-containing protein
MKLYKILHLLIKILSNRARIDYGIIFNVVKYKINNFGSDKHHGPLLINDI